MSATTETLVDLTRKDDVCIVHVKPSTLMDDTAVQVLHSHIIAGIERGLYRKLALNLTHLKFISSSALGMLVGIRMLIEEHQGEFRVFGLNQMIRELIDISNLSRMLGVRDTEDQAIASMMRR